MQGPVDETDCGAQMDTISAQGGKGSGEQSVLQKPHMRPESGTCNVCSAPCSSCMHANQALMGSKPDECSSGACHENSDSQYSINRSDVLPPSVSRDCGDVQHAVSESSILVSFTSSHDSFSENVGCNRNLRSSAAAEDVEMDTELSTGGTAEADKLSPRLYWVSDLGELSNNGRHVEGHDDNISCAGGADANRTNIGVDDRYGNDTHSLELVRNIDLQGLEKVKHVQSGNWDSNIEVEETGSNHKKWTEGGDDPGQKAHSPSVLVSSKVESLDCGDNIQKVQRNVVCGSCDVAMKFNPKSENGGNQDIRDMPDEALKYLDSTKQNEKFAEPIDLQDPPLQSPSEDESDESDVVEHDVKVCDICGDAGREDLLATCSRCIDGAEHTYCMRVRLDKVPEGEWLCEECKLAEEAETLKQDKGETVIENEKSQSSGQVRFLDTNLSVKVDPKDSDISGNRTRKVGLGTQVSRKRESDTLGVSGAVKKQVVESSRDSPKANSPTRTASLSRDSSFKKMDKEKVKSAYQASFAVPAGSPRLPTPKGTLLKSNSFSAMNMKPKVKLVDDVPEKHKRARELGSIDMKDGPPRILSKSMSFRYSNSGRANAGESKVIMLSPKSSHVQDMKGFKQAKERSTFERKNSSKPDRPMVSSTTSSSSVSAPKVDPKLTSRENLSLPPISNNRDLKPVQSDGKFAFPKPIGQPTRKGSDILGEGKWSTAGSAASTYEMRNSADQKPTRVSPKDEAATSSSCIAEKSSNNTNRVLQDSSRASVVDMSAARNLREEMNKGNELKAAIQAAILKKSIYRKNRLSDTEQSDELSLSSMDLSNDVAMQEQLPVSSFLKNTILAERKSAVESVTSNSCKENNINGAKQMTLHPTEPHSFKDGSSIPIASVDRKSNLREFPNNFLLPTSVLLKMSTIPEHEYIWQGDFEVNRGVKVPEVCYGVQAHMSTRASPKVPDMVKKFLPRVSLAEVPRLSTWPAQFHENGATEDNIALYFFARDLESYERNYKNLVESMMKGDLALKGNIGGVELLIFPSNQLPDTSQRWNMLFFLWGVFRTRKMSCPDPISDSSRKLDSPCSYVVTLDKQIPTAVTSLSEGQCPPKITDEESSACDKSRNVVPEYNPSESSTLPILSASRTTNGDCDAKRSPISETFSGVQAKSKQLNSRHDSHSSLRTSTGSALSNPKKDCIDTSMEQNANLDPKLDMKHQPPILLCGVSNSAQNLPVNQDSKDFLSGYFKADLNNPLVLNSAGSVDMEKVQERMNGNTIAAKIERNLKKEEVLDMETSPERDPLMRDFPVKQPDSWQSNLRKRPHLDLMETPVEASSSGTSETMLWNDVGDLTVCGEKTSKKLKTSLYDSSSDARAVDDDLVSRMHDVGTIFPVKEKPDLNHEITDISEESDNAERFFFPVVSHPVKDLPSASWKAVPSELKVQHHDEAKGRFHKDIPNLELALGAESKSPEKVIPPFLGRRIIDKKINLDKLPDTGTSIKEEDISATLSLSLSFPFPDKEQPVKPASKTEPLLQERRGVSGSLLLFGGYADK